MSWHFDPSGVAHYKFDGRGMVFDAIKDALATQHTLSVNEPTMWFWWNGTFCPMETIQESAVDLELAAERLYHRWHAWREDSQKGLLLSRITVFCWPKAQSSTETKRP
jgi:hypothetical protein